MRKWARYSLLALGAMAIAGVGVERRLSFCVKQYEEIVLPRTQNFVPYRYTGPSQLKLVVMGDSTTVGAGASSPAHALAIPATAALGDVELRNLGVSGARLADVVRQQLPVARQAGASYVFVSVGANDATHQTPLDSYRTDMAMLVAYLKQFPRGAVFMANTPDMRLVPALPPLLNWWIGRRCRQQNAILQELSTGTSLSIIDFYGRGKLDTAVNPEFYAEDLFHPADAGYARWAQLVVDCIAMHPRIGGSAASP